MSRHLKEFAWNTSVRIPVSAKVSDPRAVRCHNAFRYLSFCLLVVYFIYYVEWTGGPCTHRDMAATGW